MQALNGRRGANLSVRVTADERAELERRMAENGGPRALGPWLIWRALGGDQPRRSGTTAAGALPAPGAAVPAAAPPAGERLILDLCAGSGSWSAPYEAAGYRVVKVTLPDHDVRTWTPAGLGPVWGILAAPPCDQFSLARNGHPESPRDILRGLEVVSACLRIVLLARPRWWALENPVGLLRHYLGPPADTWQPCDFGDPWTKRTAIWGDFALPRRGPFVEPLGGGPLCRECDPSGRKSTWCNNPAHRARTPQGFARAFCAANP